MPCPRFRLQLHNGSIVVGTMEPARSQSALFQNRVSARPTPRACCTLCAPRSLAPTPNTHRSETKKLTSVLRTFYSVFCLLWLFLVVQAAQAQFTYLTNNGTLTVTGYTGPGGNVVIPAAANGLPVTAIGDKAFFANSDLISVIIPDSITRIGNNAFFFCENLASVTIPDKLTNIGEEAFYLCGSLRSITFPDSVSTLGDSAFAYCTSLTNAAIGNNVIALGYRVFDSCYSLTNLVIGSNVASIGDWAFSECPGLSTITIPNSVTNVGYEAFFGCVSLTNVVIGNSVGNIGSFAFDRCASLAAIAVDPLNSFFSSLDGVLFNKNRTRLVKFPEGKSGSYTIPTGVIGIGDSAFVYSASLIGVAIPESVTSIGVLAFDQCSSLTNVEMGSGVTNIGNFAFDYCTNLAGVYFRGNAPFPGWNVFNSDNQATVYYLPGTLGWGTTYSNRPTAPWVLPQPVILTLVPGFGIQTNTFGFLISWATNASVVVETSTALSASTWNPVSTNTLTAGIAHFSDPDWTNYPARFYRIRWP